MFYIKKAFQQRLFNKTATIIYMRHSKDLLFLLAITFIGAICAFFLIARADSAFSDIVISDTTEAD